MGSYKKDSYKKAAAIGGTVGGGGALSFIVGIAVEGGSIGCLCLGPCAVLVGAGVGIGAGLGCVAKLIFD